MAPEQKEEFEKFGVAVYPWEEFLLLVGLSNNLYILPCMFSIDQILKT